MWPVVRPGLPVRLGTRCGTSFGGLSNDWIHARVTDENGRPIHKRGISPVPGIYFLGFPWLHSRKSGIIHGIDEDTRFIAEAIVART